MEVGCYEPHYHSGSLVSCVYACVSTQPGGSTFLTFSKDLWEMRVKRAEIIPRSRSLTNSEVVSSDEHAKKIADTLLSSQRQMLFLGNECIRHEISEEVAGIAEAVGAMLTTASKVPVVFPNIHSNFGGGFLRDANYLMKDLDAFWSLGGPTFKLSG